MPFQALPPEILCLAAMHLDFQDILALRLASRTIRAIVSDTSINSRLFSRKQVYLKQDSLAALVEMTRPGRAGCALQHCTVTGLAGVAITECDEHINLLTTAFKNLKIHSTQGALVYLRLHVVATSSNVSSNEAPNSNPPASTRAILRTAKETFNIAMAALHGSGLSVDEHLNIFHDTRGCSLAFDAWLSLDQQFTSLTAFGNLKRLDVSLSSPFDDAIDDEDQEIDDIVYSIRPSQGIHGTSALYGLLKTSTIMPNLESLDLHWYNLQHLAIAIQHDDVAHIQSQSVFKHLTSCCIQGVQTTGSDLLRFLKTLRPKTVTLTDISLKDGIYTPIFDFITMPGTRLVHFDVPGEPKFRYRGNAVGLGPSTLTRCNDDTKEEIRYSTAEGRVLGSPERTRWLRSKTIEYGAPPGSILH
ncbi:hypothetical protein F4808DRAFT_476412 [Astrocystis sublimbata]|nr:hypothetical protein F4808DRAFT_476412 [Astrocystis sublimbata]